MFKLFTTKNERIYEKLKDICKTDSKILRTENGKPYFKDCPLLFSVSHSQDLALIAVCESRVGVDMELIRKRDFDAVLKRFSEREQEEIGGDTLKFLRNWTVKEAFIKMLGGTLAEDLKRLEYVGGELFLDGIKTDCELFTGTGDGFVYSVCVEKANANDNVN